MILKVFRAFDNLFSEKENADILLDGWEHKERVTEHFIITEEAIEEVIIEGVNHGFSATDYKLFKTQEEAHEELKYA